MRRRILSPTTANPKPLIYSRLQRLAKNFRSGLILCWLCAKYPVAFSDVDGDFLDGSRNYKLHVPKDIPVALFWSVTVYDPTTGSGLQNGQPFPSLNTMDKPMQNPDGTIDIYFGPKSPGEGSRRKRFGSGQTLQ